MFRIIQFIRPAQDFRFRYVVIHLRLYGRGFWRMEGGFGGWKEDCMCKEEGK